MKFRATVELGGKTATGIRVPDEIVAALAGGNRPRLRVTLAGHTHCPIRTANVTSWQSKAPRRPRLANGGSRRSSRSLAPDAPSGGGSPPCS